MAGFRNPIVAGLTLIRQAIRSRNYVPGVSGWSINRDGSAEFADATIRGQLLAGTAPNQVYVGAGADLPPPLDAYLLVGTVWVSDTTMSYIGVRDDPFSALIYTEIGFVAESGTIIPIAFFEEPGVDTASITFNGDYVGFTGVAVSHTAGTEDWAAGTGIVQRNTAAQWDAYTDWDVTFDANSTLTLNGELTLAGTEWTTYVPTWNGVLGNGVLTGRYKRYGKVVFCEVGLTWGATTTGTGSQWNFGFPVNAKQPGAPLNDPYIGDIKMFDTSLTQTWAGRAMINAATTFTSHTNSSPVGGVTNAAPFAWAVGDRYTAMITYEAA